MVSREAQNKSFSQFFHTEYRSDAQSWLSCLENEFNVNENQTTSAFYHVPRMPKEGSVQKIRTWKLVEQVHGKRHDWFLSLYYRNPIQIAYKNAFLTKMAIEMA